MIESVVVIGARGRVGSAVSARLRERGVEPARGRAPVSSSSASPTARSPRSPRAIEPGPWVAHVSGGTPLAALEPHERRFSRPPAPDLHARARARAARRRVGRGHGRERTRRATAASGSRETARPAAVRARRRAPRRSTTPAPRSRRTTSSRCTGRPASCSSAAGVAARGARAADAAHDRERLPADRADRARRLGDGRAAPRGDRAPRRRSCSSAYDALADAHGSRGWRTRTPAMIVARTVAGRARRARATARRPDRPRADDGRAPRRPPRAPRARARASATPSS